MRGERLARQWRILRHIEASRFGLTVAELAELEGIGVRTAYRDLEALEEAGFPLISERVEKANRWAFVDTYAFSLPQPFTMTELMALHLYRDLVRVFQGTTIYDSLESLFQKVRSSLSPRTLEYLQQLESSFAVGIKPYKEYSRFKGTLNQVNEGLTNRRRLEMAYRPLRTDKEVVRKVDPYKIWLFEGSIYLIAHCHLRNQVRMFVVDRIRIIRVTEETFQKPDDFNLDEYLGRSFKVMQDELHTVKIRISPAWSRWAGEKIWHESQKSKTLEDGSLELTFRVAGLDEIKMWVLSLGPEAEVISPRRLRDMVLESLDRTRDRYERQSRTKSAAKILE